MLDLHKKQVELQKMGTQIRLGILSFLTVGFLLTGCAKTPLFSDNNGAKSSDAANKRKEETETRETIWDLFDDPVDEHTTIAVNRYIWSASLEILDFMPIKTVDPFFGVIVFDYGTPPGGAQAYRATVLISDPALDARSLHLALMTRSGPASAETIRAVEDAILTRAAQIRQANKEF